MVNIIYQIYIRDIIRNKIFSQEIKVVEEKAKIIIRRKLIEIKMTAKSEMASQAIKKSSDQNDHFRLKLVC